MAQLNGTISDSMKKPKVNLDFQSWFLIGQNTIGALLSMPVLVTGILIARATQYDCATFMNRPVIAVGALLLFVSLAGLIAAIFDKFSPHPALAWFHLLLMFFLVTLLFCFSIFCLEITNKGLTHSVTGYGQTYKEYRLQEYPKWMRHKVEDVSYWSKVKRCLQENANCEADVLPYFSSNFTYKPLSSLTPIQGGCCIPPSACNITYLGVPNLVAGNPKKDEFKERHIPNEPGKEFQSTIEKKAHLSTTSILGASTTNANGQQNEQIMTKLSKKPLDETSDATEKSDSHNAISVTLHAYTRDCRRWSDNPEQLCYDCDTCKAGIIQSSMNRWRKAGILYDILVIIMIISYALFACYGFKKRTSIKDHNIVDTVPST